MSRIRVLFLAWGYSVHVETGIRPFSDDPEFDVAVAATHDYDFPNARNIPLTDVSGKKALQERLLAWETEGRRIRDGAGLLGRARWRLGQIGKARRVGSLLGRIGTRDPGMLRHVMNSLDLLWEMEVGLADLRILEAAVREFRPDVVFLQTLLYPCYLAGCLPRSLPVVVSFWNGDVTWWAEHNGTERLLKKRIVTHGVRRARAVTVNSKAAFEACLGYGIPAGKIHLIRSPGVDPGRFRPGDRDAARARLRIGPGKVVFCPRGLGGYLNSDVVVEAAALVAARHPDALFLFASGVGRTTELERHRDRARALGIEGRVRWEGQVPREAMPAYYNAADVVVSISSRDSLPTCMLEAMACEVPVIMGDIPPIREWVDDGVTGFLVPTRSPEALAARICEILEAPRDAIGAVTRRSLERVRDEADSGKNADRVKALVRGLAGRGNGR